MGCFVQGGKKWHVMFCPGMFCPAPKPSVLFVGHNYANSEDPNQMPQNTASDQGLHCLLTNFI